MCSRRPLGTSIAGRAPPGTSMKEVVPDLDLRWRSHASNPSLIFPNGAVAAIGSPSCRCTNPTSPASYCSPGTYTLRCTPPRTPRDQSGHQRQCAVASWRAPVGRAASRPTNHFERFIHRTGTPVTVLNPPDRSPHTQAEHGTSRRAGGKPRRGLSLQPRPPRPERGWGVSAKTGPCRAVSSEPDHARLALRPERDSPLGGRRGDAYLLAPPHCSFPSSTADHLGDSEYEDVGGAARRV